MTSVFDGMATRLAGVFGAPDILWLPEGLDPLTVPSIFRMVPVEIADETGEPVLALSPVWRVPRNKDWARNPQRGDRIQLPDGRIYRLVSVHSSGSPAEDRFLHCALEEAS
ncbi:head-tail joining protein [Pararhodobacter sp.]|uniref:head-tail joining protein n=1 Tax=Pararhodobacter sp. TaxID=2127056 RepID=UPI002FDFC83E